MYNDSFFMFGPGLFFGPLLITWLFLAFPAWRVLRRAGFSGAWVLLLLLPPIGWLVITLMLAFADWPVWRRRVEDQGNV